MTFAALFLAAALAPQEPAAAPPAPPPQAVSAGAAQEYIDAGLKAFQRRHFSAAQADFQKAVDADPQSAAATFYLGYTYYKIAEPSRRLTPGKRKAAELFAKAFELNPAFRPVWGQKG
jgi:Tfp pilus assembly protein PilF